MNNSGLLKKKLTNYKNSKSTSKTSKYYSPKSKASTSSKYYTPVSGSISSSSNNSDVYDSLSKESKDIIDKISKKPNIKKSSKPFITDKTIQKIQKFFKKYTVDEKYTLDNRVKYYNYLFNYIKDIKKNECIKISKDNSVKYTIGNKLFLIKKIGTESICGTIYITILKNVLGGNLLTSKVMSNTKDNLREINIMKRITENILCKKKSKHFLMMYKRFICPPISGRDILNMIANPLSYNTDNNISSDKKLVSINELAHGDLKMLMENRKVVSNDELMYNIFIQTFLSITTFHNLTGYYHNDAHYGNFLYQINKEIGYYHYTYNNTSYYLKACEYNIIIYDYGYATKSYKKYNKKALLDYIKIIKAFMNESDGWGNFSDLPSDLFNETMLFIRDGLMFEYDSGIRDENIQNLILEKLLLYVMENFYPNLNIFTKNKPDKIINKIPFVIG